MNSEFTLLLFDSSSIPCRLGPENPLMIDNYEETNKQPLITVAWCHPNIINSLIRWLPLILAVS